MSQMIDKSMIMKNNLPILIDYSLPLDLKFCRREIKIKITESFFENYEEIIINPSEVFDDFQTNHIFNNLDKNGLIRLGSIIKKGDCIVSKVKRYFNQIVESNSDCSYRHDNTSVFAEFGMEGMVTEITIKNGEEGSHISRIIFVTIQKI